MHMADALISPAVAGAMWVASAGAIACSSARLGREQDDRKAPLMGVLGAFLFAAQMINFSIPATGSSGHLGGGLLLSILLGPCAAFLTIASVLVVQALFFADGGLLALGCNIFNMGFIPAFVVFPLCYRSMLGVDPGRIRSTVVTMFSAVVALQLGAFTVVAETVCSGVSSLPFSTFALLMQPIHLAIGLVEGVVTLAIVSFVARARPEILLGTLQARPFGNGSLRKTLIVFFAGAVIIAGGLSLFASKDPDGLEWSIARAAGKAELKANDEVHGAVAALQEKVALFPGYAFRKSSQVPVNVSGTTAVNGKESAEAGTSVAGMVGTLLTLAIAFCAGALLKKRKRAAN